MYRTSQLQLLLREDEVEGGGPPGRIHRRRRARCPRQRRRGVQSPREVPGSIPSQGGGDSMGKVRGSVESWLGFPGDALIGRGESTWWPSGHGTVGWLPCHGLCLLLCTGEEERPVVGWAVHCSTGPLVHSVHLASVPSSNFLFCIFFTVLYFNLIQISFVEYKTCHINSRQCFELAHTISSGL